MAGLASMSSFGDRSMTLPEAHVVIGKVYNSIALDTDASRHMAEEILAHIGNIRSDGKAVARENALINLNRIVNQIPEGENRTADEIRRRFRGCRRWRLTVTKGITGTIYQPLGQAGLANARVSDEGVTMLPAGPPLLAATVSDDAHQDTGMVD